jgi:hypothetical protein
MIEVDRNVFKDLSYIVKKISHFICPLIVIPVAV